MKGDPLRVLNLEADADDHELVKRSAGKSGLSFTFERAANRAEFEAALRRGNVDLILADHCVPGFDGMAALEAALAAHPAVPYLIVSDSVGEDRAAACLRRGARDFIHKDRLDRLAEAIVAATGGGPPADGAGTEDRFREMAENLSDVFWVRAAETGRVLYVSPAYGALWGSTPDALLSGRECWPGSVMDDDLEALGDAQAKIERGEAYAVEYRIRRPDDSVRWIHERGVPVAAKGREPARMVGVASDVTDRKTLESELIQAQKMELVGKLAGGIAHDFNNLLTIISGYVSMLLDKEGMPAASIEPLKRVFTASRQATGLVRQLLLFSRKRSPKREVVDLNTEVEAISGMLQRLLGELIVVEFEPAPSPPRVSVDLAMLEQVLMNLAVNARDAMAKGGHLTITASLDPKGARPNGQDLAPRGDYACIAVRDTGGGIPAAILPRIFEPFFTTKDEGRGTGLGLATAKDIVKRHDGWIDVETSVGAGTTFRIHLPLTKSEVPPPRETQAMHFPKGGKGTILLVEDETNVREFAAAVLQQDGYTLLQSKSGENAVEVWKWHSARIDALVTDVVLPGELSGIQLAERLQREKPALRVVLATGYSRDSVAPQAKDGKNQFVLSKPYTPRALLQAVREVLA
ncbi:MAG TPA: response regulator [Opitutaceae bacterium]|jgi:hypothetical protein